jgi:transposase
VKHVGIDLGLRQSSVCVVDERGRVVRAETLKTTELEMFFARSEPSRIAIESCSESRLIALAAQKYGHDVCVVPAKFVRSLNIGCRGIKTDARDAKSLALASFRLRDELPQIPIRSDASYVLHELTRARASLLKIRTAAVNYVHSYLRKNHLAHVPKRSKTLRENVQKLLGDELPVELIAHLAIIDSVNAQIEALDAKLLEHAKSEAATRLQKIAGVGPIVALTFIATIDDPNRFATGSDLASYLGLSPGEHTTGGRIKRTGITASGQSMMRGLLVQGAHSMMNARKTREPMAEWAAAIQARSNRKRAVCALARRLAVVMWAMLRDGTSYDPLKTRPRAPRPTSSLNSQLQDAMRQPAA